MTFPSSLTLKNYAVVAACAVLCALGIRVYILIDVLAPKAKELAGTVNDSAKEFKRLSTRGADYAEFQLDLFQSPAYQKSLKASVDAPAIFNASGRFLNTQILPVARDTVKEMQNGVISVRRLVDDSNHRLNSESGLFVASTLLINNLAALSNKFGLTADELNQAIKMASEKTGLTMDEIYKRIADPRWDRLTDNLLSTSAHVDNVTGSFEITSAEIAEASKQAPSIASSLEKIAKTSSRFTKITLISNIIATLARAFLP